MASYISSSKFEQIRQVKLTPGRLGLLRRRDQIERDRIQDYENDIQVAIRSDSASVFLRTQEATHEQLRSNVPGSNRRDLEQYQPRLTTIRANLWDARVSKA
jgi:hypothetical protein